MENPNHLIGGPGIVVDEDRERWAVRRLIHMRRRVDVSFRSMRLWYLWKLWELRIARVMWEIWLIDDWILDVRICLVRNLERSYDTLV